MGKGELAGDKKQNEKLGKFQAKEVPINFELGVEIG